MKKLFLTSALFLFLLVFPVTAFAQGTFRCQWVNLAQRCESPLPQTGRASCEAGYIPGGGCSGFTTASECLNAGPFDCVAQQGCGGIGQSCCSGAICNDSNAKCQFNVCVRGTGGTESEAPDPTCNAGNGINTAIGCIPINDTNAFIGFILRWAIGIGGGIAFLLIVYAAFMIMTSRGNPERLKAGQELLTSAIAGLIMLIFSIFILRVIGVNILGIFK